MRPSTADLDSVPFGFPQMMGAPESLYVWLENRENIAINVYIVRQPGGQEKKGFVIDYLPHEMVALPISWGELLTPSKKGRIFDIGAERKSGREARRIDY